MLWQCLGILVFIVSYDFEDVVVLVDEVFVFDGGCVQCCLVIDMFDLCVELECLL